MFVLYDRLVLHNVQCQIYACKKGYVMHLMVCIDYDR